MRMLDNAVSKLTLSKYEEIVFYIIRHTDGDTKIFSRTYAQMQNDLNVSQTTIAETLKVLENTGSIFRAGNGKWYIPAVVGYEPEDEYYDWAITPAEG